MRVVRDGCGNIQIVLESAGLRFICVIERRQHPFEVPNSPGDGSASHYELIIGARRFIVDIAELSDDECHQRIAGVNILAQAAIVVNELIPAFDRVLLAFGCNPDDLAQCEAARTCG